MSKADTLTGITPELQERFPYSRFGSASILCALTLRTDGGNGHPLMEEKKRIVD